MKIFTNKLGHMTNMATMPIYGLNLKKSSSPEAVDRCLETWYVALSMRVLLSFPDWQHTFVSPSAFQEGQLSVTGESMCTKYWLTA